MLDINNDEDDENDSTETSKIKIKENKSAYDRKYIIIKFGSQNVECLLYMINEELSRVYLPQIAIVTDELLDDELSDILYDNRFITIIQENKQNIKETTSNIFTYLWGRENYFNERGNMLNEYAPSKIIKCDEEIDSYINILVVGISRAGKSTLINLLSRKLVSLESPEDKSITRNITEYILERSINGSEKKIGIKIIDTPGLKKLEGDEKNLNFTKMVIELIKKKMKECEDSKDDIHLIYFVFRNSPNLEDHVEFFRFLQKMNNERVKKNQKKIPIIFIGNENVGKHGVDALIKLLKDNDLKDLIDEIGNKKQKIDFSKYTKNYKGGKKTESLTNNNIIEVNLLANKKENKHIYGMNTLLKTTLYYLKKNNPFNNFEKLEKMNCCIQNYIQKLNKDIKFTDEEEKDFVRCKENVKNLILNLSEENFLLNQVKNTDDIIIKSRKKAQHCLYGCMVGGFSAGLIPLPFLDLAVLYPLYAAMIIKMGNCYFITFSEIPGKDFAKLIFGFDAKISKKEKEEDAAETAAKIGQKSIEATKIVGNAAGIKIGKELGSDLAKNIGLEKVKDWGVRKLRFVTSGGRQIFKKEIKEVGVKNSSGFSKLVEWFVQIFPSVKQGVKQGAQQTAESLGNEVANIYATNSVGFTAEKLGKLCEKRCAAYTTKVAGEASSYIKNLSKALPIIGSAIGGIMDCYSTYVIGSNAIKYFEDYINKTLGADYIIRQKNTYIMIFNYLEYVSEEKYEKFEFDYIC